jgi:hypothetical protein
MIFCVYESTYFWVSTGNSLAKNRSKANQCFLAMKYIVQLSAARGIIKVKYKY